MSAHWKAGVTLALCGLAIGCGGGPAAESAWQGVAELRTRYEASSYREIYAASAPEFQRGASEDEFVRFMEAVKRKLGSVKSSKSRGWNVFFGTGGSRVTLTYDTEFENGKGAEQFVWLVDGDPKLLGYNINSRDLIIK